MFRIYLIGMCAAWLGVAGIGFYFLSHPSDMDHQAYRALVEARRQPKKGMTGQGLLASQVREGPTKQVFYTKESNRLQSRLSSHRSQLRLDSREGGALELVEDFEGLTFIGQQCHPANVQPSIGRLTAEKATYTYRTGRLEAEQVQVAHYRLSIGVWPTSWADMYPFMRARANALRLSLFEGATWEASGFEVILSGEEAG